MALQRGSVALRATPDASAAPIVLGALLSLTGEWSDLGITSQAALEIAVENINAEFEAVGSSNRVTLAVKDTKLEPELALLKAGELSDEGVSFIIGPQSSEEIVAIREQSDEDGMIVVSHASTASSLAIPDDNVFRLVPTDILETEALITLMQRDGIGALVPLWREDEGNKSLHNAMTQMFPEQGGAMFEGVSYSAGTTDFSETLTELSDQVERAISEYGESGVAVQLSTFDDATSILRAASNNSTLSSVRWYGNNGVARLKTLAADDEAAAFAVETGFSCPLVGVPDGLEAYWSPVADEITERTGITPDAFSYAAYDAAWITTLAQIEAGVSASQKQLEEAFVRNSNRYFGLGTSMVLDENGDLERGHFDFWHVDKEEGAYEWHREGRYSPTKKSIHEYDENTDATPEPEG